MAFVNSDNTFNYLGFYKALRLATRIGSRITNLNMWDKTWDENQKRDRLLGVSITGQVEAFDKLGWGSTTKPTMLTRVKYSLHKIAYFFDSNSGKVPVPPTPEQFEQYYYFKDSRINSLLKDALGIVRKEADAYHEEMGIPKSLLTTCVKPSGTLSNLPTVSSGAHRPYAPYYLRRIRVSKNDPVAQALLKLGIPCVPENGQGKEAVDNLYKTYKESYNDEVVTKALQSLIVVLKSLIPLENREDLGVTIPIIDFYNSLPSVGDSLYLDSSLCNTWVFCFPIKTNAPIRAIDERAVDQLERYKQLMQNYVEHNVSFTCSVDTHEWNEVVDWLYKQDNWDNFVGISFLPRFDSENSPYPNMPYSTISKQQYEEAMINYPKFTEEQLVDLINYFEIEEEEFDLGSDCNSGAGCPIR